MMIILIHFPNGGTFQCEIGLDVPILPYKLLPNEAIDFIEILSVEYD